MSNFIAEMQILIRKNKQLQAKLEQMKRNIRKCKCPDCGFSLEQTLKEKRYEI